METIVSYLQGIGLPVEREGSGYKLKMCPLCQHNDCFKISPDGYFKCFSCGHAGDHIKFDSLHNGISYQEAKEKLTGAKIISMPDPEMDRVDRNHRRLMESPEYLSWLTEQRKISEYTITRFKVGCFIGDDGKCVYSLPYFDGSHVANIKYRTADKKIFFKRGGQEFLYNKNVLRHSETVLVVEGEMDALAAHSYKLKIPCVSVGLGAGSYKLSWREDFANIRTVYLAFDGDAAGRSGVMKLAEVLGRDKCRIVRLPLKDLNDCLIQGIERDDIDACIQKSLSVDQIEIIDAIETIPMDEPVLGDKLAPILELIAKRPGTEMEDYIRAIRARFPEVSYRQSLDFRNRIKTIQYFNKQKEPDQENAAVEQMPESLQKEAMELLKSPGIIEIIHDWLTEVGIIGEDFNKICLWLFFLSRKLDKPIHSVCFGQSSSGKSELVKKVLSTVPPEDVLEFSSMSAHALDYRDGDLIDKIIFIQEADGSDEVDYAIRIAMSEGRLIRGYTIRDEETGEMRNAEKVTNVKSAFVLTTTRSQIHNENHTRVWSLYVDESISQTKRVLEHIKKTQTRDYRRAEPERQHKVDVLRACQRLLRPLEIEVPFAHLMEFPSNTTRNRRDCSRILSFVKVVAFLRQFQKEIKQDEIGEYIEADISDYFIAHTYLLPILRNTLDEITPRSLEVLRVACLLQTEKRTLIEEENAFTTKDLQSKGLELGVDMKNVANLRQELEHLCESEYLELTAGAFGTKGSRQKFKVACQFEVEGTEVRNIRNLSTPILTPDQLASLIESNSRS